MISKALYLLFTSRQSSGGDMYGYVSSLEGKSLGKVLGGSSQDLDPWLITMVIVFVPEGFPVIPLSKWPFYGLLIWVTNHLRPSWDDPPSRYILDLPPTQ